MLVRVSIVVSRSSSASTLERLWKLIFKMALLAHSRLVATPQSLVQVESPL